MKITTRFSKGSQLYFLSILFVLASFQALFAQTISSTDRNSNCQDCTPPGWSEPSPGDGTPDVSDATTAAALGAGGGLATWVDSPGSTTPLILALPPNNDDHWLSLRDLGGGGIEEAVSTTMNALTSGRTYEVIAYTLTVVSDDNGQNDVHYAGTYNDAFSYQVGALPEQTINSLSINNWTTSRLRFTASSNSETLIIRPGNNSTATGVTDADYALFETVQISISQNGINTVPEANDDSDTTEGVTPVTFNVTDNDVDFDDDIDVATVDLDPSTTGIQNSVSNSQGTWTVDNLGNVTFTAAVGFSGDATLTYTVMDDFTLDGANQASTSNVANLTVTVTLAAPAIEVTKVALVTDNDGSGTNNLGDTITYTITLQNTGNVTLDNINITDTLEDLNGGSLSLSSGPSFLSADPGSSATLLEAGDSSIFEATFVINQNAVDSGGVNNSVLVEADPPSNMTISDTTDSPVQTLIARNPQITVFKTFTTDDTNLDGTLGVDDTVTYIITVENTGDVTLTDIDIVDTLQNFSGDILTLDFGPVLIDSPALEASLPVGQRVRYTARYVIDQADVDSGGLSNSVTASGDGPSGTTTATDISDDNDDTDGNTVDDPTVTLLPQNPSIEVTKIATNIIDNGDGVIGIDDTVSYTILVENTGNVFVENIGFVDTFQDLNGNPLQYNNSNAIVFLEATQLSPEGQLNVGEQATYTATYTITQSDVNAGGISNSLLGTATTLTGTDVDDVSDDGDDSDGNINDDPTITIIVQVPELEAVKTQVVFDNGDGETGVNDVVVYSIDVENTGNVDLDITSFVDTFTAANGDTLTLNSLTFSSATAGSSENLLLVNGRITYTATFLLTQEAVDKGGLINSFRIDATGPNGDPVFDISDDDDDSDGNIEDDPTELFIAPDPSLEVTKEANLSDNGDGLIGIDDVVTYNITVENTGNVTITNISLTDVLSDLLGNTINPAPTITFISSDFGSLQGSLVAGETATYSASYTLTQSDVNAGGISNTITANGQDPSTTPVSDVSDDGIDSDGNTTDDPTVTVIPQVPLLEITKIASVADNGDGFLGVDDLITYTILVRNIGNVDLTNVNIVDTLTDLGGDGRTLDTGPIFQPNSGGSPEGFLRVGETATYIATYLIEQRDVNAGGVSNVVVGEGEAPNGDIATDVSDDGDDTDGNTVDDPTETLIPESPELVVTKTARVDDNGNGELGVGDIITYTITVENTGNVDLTNISLVDTLTDLNGTPLVFSPGLEPTFVEADLGSSEGSLIVGEIATYTATYVLTQSDVDACGVSNSVLGSATSPDGVDVDDVSDDGNVADTNGDGNPDNDPTIVQVPENPSIEATKTANLIDDGDGFVGPGDIINYTITVQNTGNVSLNITDIIDNLTNLNGTVLTLDTPGVTYSGSDGPSPEGTLLPNETATYTASYTINRDDFISAGVSNTLTVNAETNKGTSVSDISDDGDDTDGNNSDDPTETFFPTFEITKTFVVNDNGDGVLGAGDEIVYTIIVTNNGLLNLSGISLVDTITDFAGNSRTLDSGPTLISGTTDLAPGESAEYEATYTITIDDVVAGGVRNSVFGTSTGSDGNNTSDTSDDGDDTDGNTEDDPTETVIVEINELVVIKTATVVDNGDGILGAGDTIEYTITVENSGITPLINITLTDVLTNFDGDVLSITGPTFDSANPAGVEGILLPGQIATYTASYTLTQDDVDAGGIGNTVIAEGESPIGNTVTDTSDDGDPADTNGDGDPENDPTETIIPEVLSLDVTKTASVFDDTDGIGVGDIITYTIEVTNTGNVTIDEISIIDTLTDFSGATLVLDSGPTFDPGNSDNVEGTLAPGESSTYTATYTITQSDVDAGGVSNSATANGDSPTDTPVEDISDDGDDTDGNVDDDPTETPIPEVVNMEIIKTATIDDDSDGIDVGDIINYVITVENTGNVTISGITLTDNLTDFVGNIINPAPTITFETSSLGSSEGILLVGEIATYSASYTITQSDVDAGGLSNSVAGNGTGAGGTPVDDVSDDGDPSDSDGDGDPDNDPTDVVIPENISIEVIKTFTVIDNDGILGAGDTINYEITVVNTGEVTVTITDVLDTLTNFDGTPLNLDSGPTLQEDDATILPGETVTYFASYTITQADVESGGISNTALVSGEGETSGTPIDDVSDDGDPADTDGDGDGDNDPTLTPLPEDPRLEVTKTYTIDNLGSDTIGAGDIIEYSIEIANTGNVTLTIDNITDTIEDFLGTSLSLSTLPVFDSSTLNSPEGTILPGESAFYTATYIITQSDVDAGGVSNSVFVETSTDSGTDVDDTSDDGDDTDGNIDDDPTETPIPEVFQLDVTKTADVEDTNADGSVGVGDVITYTITVQNTGNKNVTNISITDTLTDLLGNALNFDTDPGFTVFDLMPDETISFTATYTITQSDVDAGGVSNTVLASGEDEDGNPVDDVSDDGDPADSDGDGDPNNDPTETPTDDSYDLSINKVVDITEPSVGEEVTFTITISNDGLVTVNNIVVSDLLPTGYVFVSSTATTGIYSEIDGSWTIPTLAIGEIEILEITAEVLGFGDYVNIATITDTDRGADDDPNNDSDTATVDPICLVIYNEFSPNGDGVNETFVIDCIENFPDSKLNVYNRWGNIVYETIGYRNDWDGTSNGRAVVDADGQLPVGTYYYVLEFTDGKKPKTGWLYINR